MSLLLAAALLLSLAVIAVLLRALLGALYRIREMSVAAARHDCSPLRALPVSAHVARHVRSAPQPQPASRLRAPLYLLRGVR
jgi:hypothetical protein